MRRSVSGGFDVNFGEVGIFHSRIPSISARCFWTSPHLLEIKTGRKSFFAPFPQLARGIVAGRANATRRKSSVSGGSKKVPAASAS